MKQFLKETEVEGFLLIWLTAISICIIFPFLLLAKIFHITYRKITYKTKSNDYANN
jgi:hypothetical protein